MKNLKFFALFALLFISMSCGSDSSSSSKCDDMTAYNNGLQVGRDNKSMMADCDYFWEMDNDGKMSKSCYCQGYNAGHNE
jgi:hypothetical protein